MDANETQNYCKKYPTNLNIIVGFSSTKKPQKPIFTDL
jgi:hypothetical protein